MGIRWFKLLPRRMVVFLAYSLFQQFYSLFIRNIRNFDQKIDTMDFRSSLIVSASVFATNGPQQVLFVFIDDFSNFYQWKSQERFTSVLC